ncbi:hypothetical protein BCR37DRAFT_230751 [Protomyces lactucae-debilis]|uniref:Radical SAM core domain-containing protein n=1 Tax=Protomyces lactucae-debilis TaxID=2754530 RepID=A0A1Y2EQV9_PROLT|nr:uncharacterized protein BCR37DRAFT_230751 [Protomyces lactucae-debilis]ORY73674.1 hypothetical protein BCR37DRAFT_230751 [Protomyces lactucae-debilis]
MHGALSIYVHYPYCSRICSFCNFNKYLLPSSTSQDALFGHYQKELKYGLNRYAASNSSRKIRSVYFGGGTPSLAPGIVPAVLQTILECGYSLDADCEVTLEANPSSLPNLQRLSDDGVTRMSLGVQSLSSSKHLAFFRREHTVSQAISALERLAKARSLFKHGFTFDLLFGNPILPGGVQTSLQDDLALAIPFAKIGGHLSLYELIVEGGTPLARQIQKDPSNCIMPDQDLRAEEYEQAAKVFRQHDWLHYEVSSFAASKQHIGRHNFAFWMGAPLLGIGPGAHGRLPLKRDDELVQVRTRNVPDPKRWAEQINTLQHGCAKEDTLTSGEFAEELIVLGLRTSAGVSASRFKALLAEGGQITNLSEHLDVDEVSQLVEHGLLVYNETSAILADTPDEWQSAYDHGSLRTTHRGRFVLDTMLPRLLKS